MNREDTKKIIAILKEVYVTEFSKKSTDDLKRMIDVWTLLLEDEDANKIATVTKTYLKTNVSPFCPTPAMLIQKAYDLFDDEQGMTELEAWSYIDKALGRSGYFSKDEWSKLPLEVQVCVTPGQLKDWALDEHLNKSVVSSNFQRSFRERSKAIKEYNRLPKETKELIHLNNQSRKSQIEQVSDYSIKVQQPSTPEDEERIKKEFEDLKLQLEKIG